MDSIAIIAAVSQENLRLLKENEELKKEIEELKSMVKPKKATKKNSSKITIIDVIDPVELSEKQQKLLQSRIQNGKKLAQWNKTIKDLRDEFLENAKLEW